MPKTKPQHHTAVTVECDDDDDNVTIELPGAVAPGAIMMSVLEERGITPRKAAAKAGIDYETFFGVLSGVKPLTESLAQKLPVAVRGDAGFWLRVERSYEHDLARDGLERPEYDPVEAERVADQVLGPAEDGLTETQRPVFFPEDED